MAKRIFDIVVSAIAMIALSPVMALVAGLVAWKLGRPVLFQQPRAGLGGRQFVILKFRTMRDGHDAAGDQLPDEERLTRFGRWLRASSLDELPELWNVLRGDMSLVGPRPLLMDYLRHYSSDQARRHDVRPGITGWAQINGRNAQTWEERFRMDVWYVDNRSSTLDLRIILVTFWKTLTREGISAEGSATMPRFAGNGEGHGN